MSGALSAPMIDAALPPRCLELARVAVASRRGAWIARAVQTIQAHNTSLQEHGGRCAHCGHQDAGLVWDPPAGETMNAFLARRFKRAARRWRRA